MSSRKVRNYEGSVSSYTRQNKAGTFTRYRWQLWVPNEAGDDDRLGHAGYESYQAAQDALTDARRGHVRPTAGKAPTVAAYVETWLSAQRLAASTLAGYRRLLRGHVVPALGKKRLDQVRPTDIARLYKQLETSGRRDSKHKGEPLSANTINKVHVTLAAMLESAIADHWITTNPAKARNVHAPTLRQVEAAKDELKVWSAGQLHSFLQWDRDTYQDELYTLWATVADTGMRRSEALALRWGDLDGQAIRLRRAADTETKGATKKTKSGKARVIDIDDGLAKELQKWRSKRAQISLDFARHDSYVFGNDAGKIRSPNEVSRRWRTRVTRAKEALDGLPTITLHGLRHTHATLLLQAGVHPRVVQERLGHATIAITMGTYSHVMPSMQADAVQRLSMLMVIENQG